MRRVHQLMDEIEGRIRSRLPQAPVLSTQDDINALATIDSASLIGAPAPARLNFATASAEDGRRAFHFASPLPSGSATNDVASGLCLGPSSSADRVVGSAGTALVVLHRAFAPSFAAEKFLCKNLVKQGVAVYASALPYHMDRAPAESKYSGQYLLSGDIPRLVRGVLQGAADVTALVAALRESGYHDVGLIGTSLGGCVAAVAATVTPIDSLFLIMPVVDLYATVVNAPLARSIRRDAAAAGFSRKEIENATRCVTPRHLAPPKCDGSRIRVHYGLWDRQVPAGVVFSLLDAWEGATGVAHERGHRTMGLSVLKLRKDLERFVGKPLSGRGYD